MKKNIYKYIFGPIYSWRLGRSLGLDPVSQEKKICNFDCCYCQLGRTGIRQARRRIFVRTKDLIDEITSFPLVRVDYLTFSGRGEPTLARNLGEMIRALRKIRKEKIAVITNSSLIDRPDVQKDLAGCDFVLAKLDVCGQQGLTTINRAQKGIDFEKIFQGLRQFRKIFKGRLGLQVMFIEENRKDAGRIADLVRQIHPEEVHINTPLRPSASKPLAKAAINGLKRSFSGLPLVSVYDREIKKFTPVDLAATVKRHGKIKKGK